MFENSEVTVDALVNEVVGLNSKRLYQTSTIYSMIKSAHRGAIGTANRSLESNDPPIPLACRA